MLLQLFILRLANQSGRGYLPESLQEFVYCFIQVAVILGFLVHAAICSLLRGRKGYNAVSAATVCLCAAGGLVMLFVPENTLFFLVITGITVFLLGILGGSVYRRMSVFTASGARIGLCFGAGYAAAVAVQYCIQLEWTIKPLIAAFLAACAAALIFIFLRSREPQLKPDAAESVSVAARVIPVVITSAMLLFSSYFNSYIHHLQVASGYSEYNVYSWPRLLLIAGALLFGFLGDFRNGKFLPISSLCMAVIALLNAVLIGRETYLLNMCLYYLSISAAIAYYHIIFLRLAPKTRHPSLWACAGRMIDSAVVILQFIFGFSAWSAVSVLVMDIAALTVTVVMMAVGGDFNLTAPVSSAEHKEERNVTADCFEIIREEYGLTQAELKVFRELVQSDDKQETVANRLNMSVNTLRHHITSIYKKTGVQTRKGLYQIYHTNEK